MRSAFVIACGLAVFCGLVAAVGVFSDVAMACFPRSACQAPPKGAPGPLIGVGAPVAGAALAMLLVVRRFRRKD